MGVERTFPVHTPVIEKFEMVRRGDVRRAKLYYLRDLRGKASKIKERRGANNEFITEEVFVEEVVETFETPQEVAAVVEAPVETVEVVEEAEAVRVIEKELVAEVEPVADEAAPATEQA